MHSISLILTTEGGETVIQTGVHKKNELDYFFVEESYGGNQDLFPEISMRDGGCGAVAACESCIYFARRADTTPDPRAPGNRPRGNKIRNR